MAAKEAPVYIDGIDILKPQNCSARNARFSPSAPTSLFGTYMWCRSHCAHRGNRIDGPQIPISFAKSESLTPNTTNDAQEVIKGSPPVSAPIRLGLCDEVACLSNTSGLNGPDREIIMEARRQRLQRV